MEITKLRSFVFTHIFIDHPQGLDGHGLDFFGIKEVPVFPQITDSKIPIHLYNKGGNLISIVTAECPAIYSSLECSVLYIYHRIEPEDNEKYDKVLRLIEFDNTLPEGEWIKGNPFANEWNPIRWVLGMFFQKELEEFRKDLAWYATRSPFDPVKQPE